MANYNSNRAYNKNINDGGASYNSAPFTIVIFDAGTGNDAMSSLIANVNISDSGAGNEDISANITLSLISDSGIGLEDVSLSANMDITDAGTGNDIILPLTNQITITDSGMGDENILATITLSPIADNAIGDDAISLTGNLNIIDAGNGNDIMSLTCQVDILDSGSGQDEIKAVQAFFLVDSNNVLQPLGVLVLRDSRYELLPATRDNTEEVPGAHGELDFGTEFKARSLELHVATDEGYSPLKKAQLQRLFAQYLDPTKGTKALIFSDDIEKTYIVKYSGKIDPTQYPTWFEFTIPFKMSKPFIIGSFEKTLVGSGTITNEGTFEVPLTIEIAGPVTNPSVVIGADTLAYTGTISTSQKLIIDTGIGTAKIGSVNAMGNYNGIFPMLQPGSVNVTAGSNVTISWKDRWL